MATIFKCKLALSPACRPGDRVQVALTRGADRALAEFASDLVDRYQRVSPFVRVDADHRPCPSSERRHLSIEKDRAGTRLYRGRSQTPLKSRRAVQGALWAALQGKATGQTWAAKKRANPQGQTIVDI